MVIRTGRSHLGNPGKYNLDRRFVFTDAQLRQRITA